MEGRRASDLFSSFPIRLRVHKFTVSCRQYRFLTGPGCSHSFNSYFAFSLTHLGVLMMVRFLKISADDCVLKDVNKLETRDQNVRKMHDPAKLINSPAFGVVTALKEKE